MSEEKTCFVIAPIGEPESETRKRSDQIFKHIITPAAEECGYSPIRADHISEPGIITTQVIHHIVEDPLVIADLTGRNPNVFYELAIRHAIKEPLVQIIQKGEPIPFDVAATRTIQVDHRDLDSVEEAKTEIVRQIKAVEGDPSKIDTPISVALDLQALTRSGNPEQRSIASIEEAVHDLRSTVLALERRLERSGAFPQYEFFHDKGGVRRIDRKELAHAAEVIRHAEKLNNGETLIAIFLEPSNKEALARAIKALRHAEKLSTEEQEEGDS